MIRLNRISIDAIDGAIARLQLQRKAISESTVRAKRSLCLSPVDLARERAVISTYTSILGENGRNIAYASLQYSKGF